MTYASVSRLISLSALSKEQALIRECKEELDITVLPDKACADVTYEYPDITIHLTLFSCTITQGTPKLLEHKDLRWITKEEIPKYEFCPADREMLKGME